MIQLLSIRSVATKSKSSIPATAEQRDTPEH
jgi:hypothetical protein